MKELTDYEKNQLLEAGYIYDPVSNIKEEVDSCLPEDIISFKEQRDKRVSINCDDCGFDKGNIVEDNMIANCDRCGKINDIEFGGC